MAAGALSAGWTGTCRSGRSTPSVGNCSPQRSCEGRGIHAAAIVDASKCGWFDGTGVPTAACGSPAETRRGRSGFPGFTLEFLLQRLLFSTDDELLLIDRQGR